MTPTITNVVRVALLLLRWLLALPLGIIGGLAARYLLLLFFRAGAWLSGESAPPVLNHAFEVVSAAVGQGIATTFLTAAIIPTRRSEALLGTGAAILLLAGFLSFPSVMAGNWLGVAELAGVVAGAAGFSFHAYLQRRQEETDEAVLLAERERERFEREEGAIDAELIDQADDEEYPEDDANPAPSRVKPAFVEEGIDYTPKESSPNRLGDGEGPQKRAEAGIRPVALEEGQPESEPGRDEFGRWL